jgi:hypothetical protein
MKRSFKIIAVKGEDSPKRIPRVQTSIYDARGPLSALKQLHWDMEQRYGLKYRKYYPNDRTTIEEIL